MRANSNRQRQEKSMAFAPVFQDALKPTRLADPPLYFPTGGKPTGGQAATEKNAVDFGNEVAKVARTSL